MKMRLTFGNAFLAYCFLTATTLSCTKEAEVAMPQEEEATITAAAQQSFKMSNLLKDVRNATARYHSTTQAINAGYQPTDHCVPQMGYHWANYSLVDDVFDPLKPEVLLYEKKKNGKWRLVAVEYIVKKTSPTQSAPNFDGHPFDVGGTPTPGPHWSLHVWLYEDNPDGIFTNFNPNISCN